MERQHIPIKVSSKLDLFKAYTKLMSPYLKLRDTELLTLASIMYFYNEYKEIKEPMRSKLVFDYSTKASMAEHTDSSLYVINNRFTALRKAGFIKNNSLIPGLQIYPTDNTFNLSFTFTIDDEGQTRK